MRTSNEAPPGASPLICQVCLTLETDMQMSVHAVRFGYFQTSDFHPQLLLKSKRTRERSALQIVVSPQNTFHVLLQGRTFRLRHRLGECLWSRIHRRRQHEKTANYTRSWAIDRQLDYSWPRMRSGISGHSATASRLHAGRLAALQLRDSKCEPNCRLPATEYTPALSGLPSRVRHWRCACPSKRPDRTAAVRCASAAVCNAPRQPAISILLRRRLLSRVVGHCSCAQGSGRWKAARFTHQIVMLDQAHLMSASPLTGAEIAGIARPPLGA